MSIRQRLYPDAAAALTMVKHCSDSRFVWNLGLEQRNLYRPHATVKVTSSSQMRELAEARKITWLGEGSSVVQQQALRDLNQAFQNWWDNPHHFGRPTWRRIGVHESFRVVNLITRQINRKWGEVQIPKVGWVKFRLTRPWGDIAATRSARVKLSNDGRWYITFTAPQPVFERTSTNYEVGLDMGITVSVATSDGEMIQMPKLLSDGEAQRKLRLQRKLARQVKGSNRRGRTKMSLAALTQREVSRRTDWIEKTTTRLVFGYDMVAIEDLRIITMVKSAKGTLENPRKNVKQKSGLSRSIHQQSWGKFRTRLTNKANTATSPVVVVAVSPAFTSQRCSSCGHTEKKNRESQATFLCCACGYSNNADVNAAINILAAGQAVTGRGGTSHATPATVEHSDPMKRQPLTEAVA